MENPHEQQQIALLSRIIANVSKLNKSMEDMNTKLESHPSINNSFFLFQLSPLRSIMSDESAIDTIMDDLLMEESQLEQDISSSDDENEELIDAETQARRNWVVFMRNQFSVRAEYPSTETILKANGRLNQEYFRPKTETHRKEERAWTDAERDLLIQGIQKYGIGNWNDIRKELLNEWTSNDLRLKCIRLIGRQNLQLYKDWKGNADEIQQEYENNKRVGSKHSTWKQGVLVYDDDGKVEEELMAYHQK
ncbi:conserved hypothetical protein [Mucor ambiguus]|uniref:DASH complex subunit DAD4 n=1 Tax=Mucor ambiguus TaxID=91626 RepID=A0A0C9MQD3_9FUNG|nr:conserved hypothetical protein [Mucor ambiguus]